MFTECRKLKTIYVSEGWSVAKVKSDTYMFSSCTSIRGGSGKTYNRNQLGKSMANYSNGYLTYKAYTAKANIAAPSSSVIISSAKATDGLTVEEILNNDSVFTDPIRAVNEENTDTENEDVDTQNADVAVQSMDDPSGKLLYSHSDLNDENETFYVPKVQTVLTNTANDHYFTTAAGSTLVDTVTYSGLKPGRAYTLTGKLMDKDTGKAATDKSGKEITGTATFTPSTAKVMWNYHGVEFENKMEIEKIRLKMNNCNDFYHEWDFPTSRQGENIINSLKQTLLSEKQIRVKTEHISAIYYRGKEIFSK